MKQKIEKFPALIAVVCAMVLVAYGGVVAAEGMKKFPPAQAGYHEGLTFYGATPMRILKSASAQLLVTGEGLLDAICPLGGVSGQYSLAFDSASASGITVNSELKAISRNAFVRLDSAADTGDGGCWIPKWGPVRFVNGLVGIQSTATHSTLFYVHASSGGNPGIAPVNKP